MLFRFYGIRCSETNDYYIGKTKQKLLNRLRQHETLKNCESKIITQYKSCVIILLEEVDCSEEESVAIERAYIETYVCVNKVIPGRTRKEYNKDKKVEIAETIKEYQQKNKVKIAEYDKKYHQENKVEIAKRHKIYQQENKVELAEKRKEKAKILYTCKCGKTFRIDCKTRHDKSNYHINYIDS
jgi:hypothetical protein